MSDTAAISFGSTSGRLLLELAGFLTNPVAHLSPERVVRLAPEVDREAVARLSAGRGWGAAVSGVVRRATGLEGAGPDRELISRLKVSDEDQVLLRVALAPEARLTPLLATMAGCIYRGAISGAIAGARVRQLRAAFGQDAFEVGLRQATLLYPDLADFADAAMTFPEVNPETGKIPEGTPFHIRDAQIVLGRMMEARHPLFGQVFDVRFGWKQERKSPRPPAWSADLTDRHTSQMMKLLRMKNAQWQMYSS